MFEATSAAIARIYNCSGIGKRSSAAGRRGRWTFVNEVSSGLVTKTFGIQNRNNEDLVFKGEGLGSGGGLHIY